MQEVSKPLIDINDNPHNQEFEGLQGNHLDGVQLLCNDNEQTKTNSSLILVKSQTTDVLTKGIYLTKTQGNNPDESNALLKELGYGYINIKEKEFVVIDV